MKQIPRMIVLTVAAASCEPAAARTEPPAPMPGESPFEYPVELWDRGIEGEALLLVHVTALGDVDSVTVEASSGQPAFDSAAVQGARALRFAPARLRDRRIPAWTRVPVRFRTDTTDLGMNRDGNE
jgi:protein TonB